MKVWLLQIPRLSDQLTAGIRIVSHMLSDLGVENEIVDLNTKLYRKYYGSDKWADIEKFGYKATYDISLCPVKEIEELWREELKEIKDGDIVLLSVFSTESRCWSVVTSTFLRGWYKRKIKIGMGGTGLRNPGETLYESEWTDKLMERRLVDFALLGHVDKILPMMVKKQFDVTGKFYDQGKDFPEFGFHSKKLLNFDKEEDRIVDPMYVSKNSEGHAYNPNGDPYKPTIYFTQGCIKRCTFCDVPTATPEWAMRPAERVVEEIDHYYNIDGRTEFHFADNTINGSDSEFLKFLRLVCDWQDKNEKLQWSSQYALKRKSQQPDELFDLLAKSNGRLAVGFDHTSDAVLTHMKKLYVWDDIEHFLDKTKLYSVPISLAMWIVGYPTESKQDFLEYKKLTEYLKHNGSSILSHSVLTCSINRNSVLLPLVDIDWHKPVHWIGKTNGLDFNERIDRKKWLDAEITSVPQDHYKQEIAMLRLLNS